MVFYFEGEILTEKQYFDKLYIKNIRTANWGVRKRSKCIIEFLYEKAILI